MTEHQTWPAISQTGLPYTFPQLNTLHQSFSIPSTHSKNESLNSAPLFWRQEPAVDLELDEKRIETERQDAIQRTHLLRVVAFTILTILALIIWQFAGSVLVPWFVIVVGVFVLIWVIHFFVQKLNDPKKRERKRDTAYQMHLGVSATVNITVMLTWLFLAAPNSAMGLAHHPWFLYVWAFSAILLVIHYSIAYLTLSKFWIIPQVYIYWIVSVTTFAVWYFGPPGTPAWYLWPVGVWGLLIVAQIIIYLIVEHFKEKSPRKVGLTADPVQKRTTALYALPQTLDLRYLREAQVNEEQFTNMADAALSDDDDFGTPERTEHWSDPLIKPVTSERIPTPPGTKKLVSPTKEMQAFKYGSSPFVEVLEIESDASLPDHPFPYSKSIDGSSDAIIDVIDL